VEEVGVRPIDSCSRLEAPDDLPDLKVVVPLVAGATVASGSLAAEHDDVLDHSPSFNDSVRLAAELTGSPMAAIALVGDDYQWFKAKTGFTLRGMRAELGFCHHVVQSSDLFIVENVGDDARFAANALVVSERIRSCAAAPLIMPSGERVGAISIFDTQARSFTAREGQVLQLLARQVVFQLQVEQLVHRQAEDIDELRVARVELRHMAMHDELTGLLNRRGAIGALDRLCNSTHPSARGAWQRGISVLFLDLDEFKAINDTMGHEIGDRVLIETGERLCAAVRPGDTVGRLGGDEFIVVMVGAGEEESDLLAEKLLRSVERPIDIDGQAVMVEASIGVANAADFGNVLELIDHADRAMYWSKQAGGHSISTYSESVAADDTASDRKIKKFVRSCLENDLIEVHYQPMFDLRRGELIRREALLRWEGEAPGDLNVEGFIHAAERAGLISRIGSLVLQDACESAAQWQKRQPGVGVSVNVSALQVTLELPDVVAAALDRSHLAPELLTLELTESSLLECTHETTGILDSLHAMGVRMALDDFGTGYASMSMLCALPLDEVKIDRRFCADATTATAKVVRATVDLGHSLGLCVVAEGIETQDMLDQLVQVGCDVGQGYLLGHPNVMDRRHLNT